MSIESTFAKSCEFDKFRNANLNSIRYKVIDGVSNFLL